MVLGLWDFLFCVLGRRVKGAGTSLDCCHKSPARDGMPQRLTHKFESRDEWPVARD